MDKKMHHQNVQKKRGTSPSNFPRGNRKGPVAKRVGGDKDLRVATILPEPKR